MNKYLIIATDDRSYLDLKNIAIELKSRDIPYFFLYSRSPHRSFPTHQLDRFNYDSNIDIFDNQYFSKTLGINLPFKPDVLLITNESWEPEKSILWEFKQWGCFIGCIENGSRVYVNLKSKLELVTRKSFPTNCVDVFFDHSEWGKESKVLSDWFPSKSVVTGNPRNDSFRYDNVTKEKIIIVYGSMENETHYNILKIYQSLAKLEGWKVYYKAHPSETKDFPNDFNDVNLIKGYDEYFEILPKSHHHVGMFSSVMYFPLVLGKNVVCIDSQTSGMIKEAEIENYKGHEFNFWSRILGFKTFKDFTNFIGEDFVNIIKKRNKTLENHILKNLVLYKEDHIFLEEDSPSSNNSELLHYFDEFNDNKASHRIINYIEQGIL